MGPITETGFLVNLPVVPQQMRESLSSIPSVPSTPTEMDSALVGGSMQFSDMNLLNQMTSPSTAPQLQTSASTNGPIMNGLDTKTLSGSRYKTEMCRPFTETGFCKYGDKCQFAHGSHEMKCMPRHPKYKSEYCRTFHTTGLCPYGPRCHFIHSEDESKLTEINLMKQQAAARQATQQMLQQALRLRAQQQAIQAQMQALVLSQFHIQNVQKPVPAVQKPVLMPQMSVPATVPSATTRTCVQQPQFANLLQHRNMERSLSLPVEKCESLGSVADTPPITPTCGSPVFNSPSKKVSPPPGFAPMANNGSMRSAQIQGVNPKNMCNLDNVFSDTSCSLAAEVSELLAGLEAMDLDSNSSLGSNDLYTPSTSPDSMLQSPLGSPRVPRLPIFSQISQNN